MDEQTNEKRHPFRFLLKLGMFAGVIYAAGRFVSSKKAEFYGLTESEARAKMKEKLEPRIGEEKATEVTDQVVPMLKERGVIKSDPVHTAAEDLADTLADSEDAVDEAVESLSEAVESSKDE